MEINFSNYILQKLFLSQKDFITIIDTFYIFKT